MKNATFFESVKCACKGMIYAFKTEKNFKYYFCIALFFTMINILIKISINYYVPYVIAIGAVFSSEFINTAIEHTANYVTSDICNEIKLVKDIAAAAVLFSGIIYFCVEFFIIGMTIL